MTNDYARVLHFWFKELTPDKWWVKSLDLDSLIKNSFGDLHRKAVMGELSSWREAAEGRLAEIIVLDQFSRNIYRDTPQAFASDAQGLTLAQELVSLGLDKALPSEMRPFAYMPYMHSESLLIHEHAVELFKKLNNEGNLKFEYAHKEIIEKFGRYPHRNKILNRVSTPEEIEFLKGPNSGF